MELELELIIISLIKSEEIQYQQSKVSTIFTYEISQTITENETDPKYALI